jgi:hypothetical protein
VTVGVGAGAAPVWAAVEGRARTAVRQAMNAGFTGTVRPAGAGDLVPGSPFRRLYEQTMVRVHSSPAYVFADEYYSQLLAGLGGSLLLAQVRAPDGRTAAAALVLAHRERVHYHLAGSVRDAATAGVNNLLVWTILRWAADDGRGVVHLGGGRTSDDDLFRFKRCFGGQRTQFWTCATVLDPKAYATLVNHRAAAVGTTPDALQGQGFFPAYRFGSVVL